MRAFYIPSGRALPEALEREGIQSGYVELCGEVDEVVVRNADGRAGQSLSGTWTLASGKGFAPFASFFVVLGRQGPLGHEVYAGELLSAVAKKLRGIAFDSGAPATRLDGAPSQPAGKSTSESDKPNKTPWSLAAKEQSDAASSTPPADGPVDEPRADGRRVVSRSVSQELNEGSAWAEAARASAARETTKAQGVSSGNSAPQPIPKIRAPEQPDTPFPLARDWVSHFAFGVAEVLKSDGDRLHVKVAKDGRIKEIALAMLSVSRLEDQDGKRMYKLDRK
jgi:hypothetical protein